MTNHSNGRWKYRRRVIFLTLLFCGGVVAWCVSGRVDPELAETAILAMSGLGGSVIGSYVFGATWDDNANANR